jgi:hypothetical protein
MPEATPAVRRVDRQEADVRAVVARHRGHDPGGRVAEDGGRLVRREEGAVELVERRRVGHRSAAQLRDALPLGRAQACRLGHGDGRAAPAALGSTATG